MKKITIVLWALFWAGGSLQALETPRLQEIMADLGQKTQEIQKKLLRGETRGLAVLARAVAEHPQVPPAERKQIMQALGKGIKSFKGYDVTVHQTASRLAQAAEAGDLPGAAEQYTIMLQACFGCHQGFRGLLKNQ